MRIYNYMTPIRRSLHKKVLSQLHWCNLITYKITIAKEMSTLLLFASNMWAVFALFQAKNNDFSGCTMDYSKRLYHTLLNVQAHGSHITFSIWYPAPRYMHTLKVANVPDPRTTHEIKLFNYTDMNTNYFLVIKLPVSPLTWETYNYLYDKVLHKLYEGDLSYVGISNKY